MLEKDKFMQIAKKLKERRMQLGLSQQFVADSIGVPRSRIMLIEKGERKINVFELDKLSRLYNRPMDYFYKEVNQDELTLEILDMVLSQLYPSDRIQVLRYAQFLKNIKENAYD